MAASDPAELECQACKETMEVARFSPKNSPGTVLLNAAEAGRRQLNAVDGPQSWAMLQGGGCDRSLTQLRILCWDL